MNILYVEFLFPIIDYARTLKLNEFLFDIALPFLIAIVARYFIVKNDCTIIVESADSLFKTVITLLSILIGFTVSSITILASTGSKIEEKMTDRHIGKTEINLYQLTNIFFTFALFSEVFTLVVNLISVIMLSYNIQIVQTHLNELVVFDLFLLSHILLLNIRNMSNFYFILHMTTKSNNKTQP